jgi:hypothetical protein
MKWCDNEQIRQEFEDFMDSLGNSHLCDTQDETLGSEEPEFEFIAVELIAVNPFP